MKQNNTRRPQTRVVKSSPTEIRGNIIDRKSREPLEGYLVQVYDVDKLQGKNSLGEGRTNKDGDFKIKYNKSSFARNMQKLFPDNGPDLLLKIYDKRKKLVHTTDMLTGSERFEEYFIELPPLSEDEFRKRFTEKFGDNFEKFFEQKEISDLFAKFIAKESPLTEEEIGKALREADPLGFSAAAWRSTLWCMIYQFYDALKQTSLWKQLVGNTYIHLWEVQNVRGWLTGMTPRPPPPPGVLSPPIPTRPVQLVDNAIEGYDIDQDFNFRFFPYNPTYQNIAIGVANSGILPPDDRRQLLDTLSNVGHKYFHSIGCEIIPCDNRRLGRAIRDLRRFARANRSPNPSIDAVVIEVSGTLTWDGGHLGFPGHLEIHPVTNVRCIQTIPNDPTLRCM